MSLAGLAGCEAAVATPADETTDTSSSSTANDDTAPTGSSGAVDESSGGVPVEVCNGEEQGGGASTPIVGSGATITDVVEVDATITLEDLGASLGVTPRLLEDDTMPATLTLTSLAEPTPPGLFAMGPIFELRAQGSGYIYVDATGTPMPERVGTCRPGLWLEIADGWTPLGGYQPVLAPDVPPARVVVASACAGYTCGGECAAGTEEATCGGCDGCGEAVCVTPGTCDGHTLGESGALEIRSDGTNVWWIDPIDQRSIFAASPPAPATEVATADMLVLDLSVAQGVAYWIELTSGNQVDGFGWAVRRAALG